MENFSTGGEPLLIGIKADHTRPFQLEIFRKDTIYFWTNYNADHKDKAKAAGWAFSVSNGQKDNATKDFSTLDVIALDIDAKDQPTFIAERLGEIQQAINSDPRTFWTYRTFSGGLRVVYRAERPVNDYQTLEATVLSLAGELQAKYGLVCDLGASRIRQDLFYFGQDVDSIYFNPDAERIELSPVITTPETAKPLPAIAPAVSNEVRSTPDFQPLSEKDKLKIMEALKTYAKRGGFSDRDNWLKLGAALFEAGYSTDQWYELSDRDKFPNLISDIATAWESFKRDYTGDKSKIGTLIFFAKQVDPHLKLDAWKPERKLTTGDVVDLLNEFTDQWLEGNVVKVESSYLLWNMNTSIFDFIDRKSLRETTIYQALKFMQASDDLRDYNTRSNRETAADLALERLDSIPPLDDSIVNNPETIVFENVTYHIDSDTFTTPAREDLMTYRIPQTIDPDIYYNMDEAAVKASSIYTFVNSLFDDPIMTDNVFKLWAVSLSTITVDKFFIFEGEGRNGKSMLTKVMSRVIGQRNISNVSLSGITEGKFDLSGMISKTVNIAGDIDERRIEASGILKEITGGDMISVRPIYKAPISVRLYPKLIFNSNRDIYAADTSYGFSERYTIFKFPFTFTSDENKVDNIAVFKADPAVLDGIDWTETSAVLLYYLKAFKKEGFIMTAEMIEEKTRIENLSSSVFSFWGETSTIINTFDAGENEVKPDREIFSKYFIYCQQSNIRPVSLHAFQRDSKLYFEKKGIKQDHTSRGYKGVKFDYNPYV